MRLLLLIYDFLFFLGLGFYIPQAFRQKKLEFHSLKSKFGFIKYKAAKESIWIHAVSVGEVKLIAKIIPYLKQYRNYELIISTTTLTGNKLAREGYGNLAHVIYFPFDISFVVKRIIRLIRPRIFVSVETEIWPNLFYYLKRARVPILIINGRISDKAFKNYRRIRPIMKRILECCSYVGVQNQEYKERFMDLGCDGSKISISGQMKFQTILMDKDGLKRFDEKYSPFFANKNGLLIVAGSTHADEEKIMVEAYSKLLASNRNIRLVIAPRHVERAPAIEKIIQNYGYHPVKISNIRKSSIAAKTIFIFDTIGELPYLYSIADICFVGGSFIPHGGQNILEPIFFSKPTLFGPHMENFRDIEDLVLKHCAGIKVANVSQFETELRRLIDDSAYRSLISGHCQEVFKEAGRSVEENAGLIAQFLQ